jgi:hypothetical protein
MTRLAADPAAIARAREIVRLTTLEKYRKPKPARFNACDRPCLCCGEIFRSEGPHNRLCTSCRANKETNHGQANNQLRFGRGSN